jgi:pimeloyl-ACP methyl ester carboxylesterase
MKAMQFIKLLILFFYTISCAGKNHDNTAKDNSDTDTTIATNIPVTDTFETGKVITHVICKDDGSQSYALYIPAKGNKEILPVIYFFDPHGDGSFPLDKYKALSDAYDFILIGSNNSKNGNDWTTAENIWNTLFDDSQKRLKINTNRIYTCGFSGGAKVATYVALHHNEIKGVIANGAALPDVTHAGNFSFSFTAIAGEGDLNMTDLVAITNGLDQTQMRHRIIFFDGIHEWAPESTMNIAFTGLQLDAMHEKAIPVNNVFISNYIAGSKKRIDEYLKTNNYLKAESECKLSISMLDDLTNDADWFKEKDASLKNNSVYQKQWQAKQKLLVTEQNLKDEYDRQFQQADMNYWIKTINDIETRAKAATAEGSMYQRLQAYLSLAFYSISNQLIKGKQDAEAQYFVNLYKIVDPANSEAWYFSAILNARNNNVKATEDDLLKAVANGFNDKIRLIQQSEFQQLGTQINLEEIESKMK